MAEAHAAAGAANTRAHTSPAVLMRWWRERLLHASVCVVRIILCRPWAVHGECVGAIQRGDVGRPAGWLAWMLTVSRVSYGGLHAPQPCRTRRIKAVDRMSEAVSQQVPWVVHIASDS